MTNSQNNTERTRLNHKLTRKRIKALEKRTRKPIRRAKTSQQLITRRFSAKKPQECHLKKLKRTMLIFSLWQTKWTKGYLEGKKAGRSDSIFKTYHLILEPAFKTSKGSHYIFCGRDSLAPRRLRFYLWIITGRGVLSGFISCNASSRFVTPNVAFARKKKPTHLLK